MRKDILDTLAPPRPAPNPAWYRGESLCYATLSEFVDYVWEFYGEGGLYPIGVTREQIVAATRKHVESGFEFGADSVDREKIREILTA